MILKVLIVDTERIIVLRRYNKGFSELLTLKFNKILSNLLD